MEPSQPPQDSQPPQQGWPAPEPSNPMGAAVPPPQAAAGPGPYAAPGPYAPGGPGPYGPVPYGSAPYGPYGPGQGPHGPQRPITNGLAIASLVSGIVCCLPPLGLVFGLIALPQIKKKNQTGKGLAVAGIVLSALSSLLLIWGLVSGGFSEAWRSFEKGMDEAATSQSTFSLRTGQCYDVIGEVEALGSDVDVVDCAGEHEAEVTGSFTLTGFTGWPGDDRIDKIAVERCEEISYAYAMDYWAIPDEVWTYYYIPTSHSWRAGDRTVTCAFIVDGDPFKGSLRNDATTLGADQIHFLKALNPIQDAMGLEPEKDADEDLAANTAWAREVHTAINGASAALKGHSWPGASAAPVAELVKELDAAAKEWNELAKAADGDAFWEHYDTAYDLTVWESEPDARGALGLTRQAGPGTAV